MKQLFDFFPVAAFVAVYFFTKDMILSTIVLIGASGVQLLIGWLIKRKVEKVHLYTFFVLLVMGGLTIALRNPVFIMWKSTIINWTFAITFLGSQFIGSKPLVRRLLEGLLKQAPHLSIDVPEDKWKYINLYWVLFFIFAGTANLYVAFNFEESVWVSFKFIGMTLIHLVFFAGQFFYLARFMVEDEIQTENKIQEEEKTNSPQG